MSHFDYGVVLLGAGGHSRAVDDVINSMNGYSISCNGAVRVVARIIDTRKVDWHELARQYPKAMYVLGVGQIKSADNRIDIAQRLNYHHLKPGTLISPHAYVSPDAKIGKGTVILHGAVVNANAVVGDYCIVNTNAVIEHDAHVSDFCHISTGAIVNGEATVLRESFVGSNSVVLNQIKIGKNVILGAGSIAVTDIKEPGTYRGNPCGRIK